MRSRALLAAVLVMCTMAALPSKSRAAPATVVSPMPVRACPGRHWVASWIASPTDSATPIDATGGAVPQAFDRQTLRMIVTPHLGGSVLRIHMSNRFGSKPVTFGRVTVGRRTHGATATDLRPVTFRGKRAVTVAPGHDVISDAVRLRFDAFAPLAVSIYVPKSSEPPTKHWNANATSYYSAPGSGDVAGRSGGKALVLTTEAWFYLDGLDVRASSRTRSVVAFGDSITDGFVAADPASLPATRSVANKNGRYPDDLQRRLDAAGIAISVVDGGIGSNRLLTDGEPLFLGLSGLQRLREDALRQAGVTGVLLQEGINDLGIPPATTTAAELIAGYRKAIAETHAAGLKIWLGTLLPASNAAFDGVAAAPNSERYREKVNAWIRHQRAADGVVDFAAALQDPADHAVLRPAYSGPDHLHPNLRGYRVMARAVSLEMLSRATRCTGGTGTGH